MRENFSEVKSVTGEFISLAGERFYVIREVDQLEPLFVTLISASDHWLFFSSTGGLTAGRVSPDTALFPYVTVDKIHESVAHTGSKTMLRVNAKDSSRTWEPFNREHDDRYSLSRHLYKSALGNSICFEEINHDLQLAFRYHWKTSEDYGFVRQCELMNQGTASVQVELLDGLQNILPAGTQLATQTRASNLVDAYKWNELDESTGLACFTLYSGISDRAEPSESLKATTVFCLGLDSPRVLLGSAQMQNFRQGMVVHQENLKRGVRGAYLVNASVDLAPNSTQTWQLIADVEQSQGQVVELCRQLQKPADMAGIIADSVQKGDDQLARIVAAGDGFQLTAEENVTVHHFANAVFNILRGGIFADQYNVCTSDFTGNIKFFNNDVYRRHVKLLEELPGQLNLAQLQSLIREHGDSQLVRLGLEYLPITFGRRHGDPSRPWNQFAIKLKDKNGDRLLSYQGNWRDIFQNWEALTFSYPEFIESIIAKFVNASTMDGYNPYRITREGIDWEVEEPDNPWSYIGYWGDHQIIYLLKLLELSSQFHPDKLAELLQLGIFSYANVPYRIKPFEALLEDAKNTVVYDRELSGRIEQRVADMGADGKLVLDGNGEVYLVNLLEKLLVPLLSKLGNLVVDGGIWLNTQRPEWNDANNALVGHGLSMVTLYYLRRYISFLRALLSGQSGSTTLSVEVNEWLNDTASALAGLRPLLGDKPVNSNERYHALAELGQAASRYRQAIYRHESPTGKVTRPIAQIRDMLDDAMAAVDHSVDTNLRKDGLYHSYNLLELQPEAVEVERLYPMLEGQVAVLSAGVLTPEKTVMVLEALFDSDIYRPDQKSFMLYPDRSLPGFLAKNRISAERIEAIPLLVKMLEHGDQSIVYCDAEGTYRFNAEFTNIHDLDKQLDGLDSRYGGQLEAAYESIRLLYEQVFNHRAFTGRSGGMFGFEGLGCIYWHMVAKLLLAIGENFFSALEQGADRATCERLGSFYYRVRAGLGFNKTPSEYGAFPADPYSHTPRHAGAQQPGMTGQVKEELLARYLELGIRVKGGCVSFVPALLRPLEFSASATKFRFLDVHDTWQTLKVPEHSLAFTWCQTPVVIMLDDDATPSLTVIREDGSDQVMKDMTLPAQTSTGLFTRSGSIRRLELVLGSEQLFTE
jgi:hypothetical protein